MNSEVRMNAKPEEEIEGCWMNETHILFYKSIHSHHIHVCTQSICRKKNRNIFFLFSKNNLVKIVVFTSLYYDVPLTLYLKIEKLRHYFALCSTMYLFQEKKFVTRDYIRLERKIRARCLFLPTKWWYSVKFSN